MLASGWCELAPLAFALSEGRTKRKWGGQDGENGCVRLRTRGGGGWLHAAMVRGHLAGWMDRRNISLSRCRHVAPKRTGPSGSLDCCISHAIYSWVPAGMAEVFGVSVCRPDLAQCPPSHQHHGASVRAMVSRVGKLERSKFMHTPLPPAGRVLDLSPRPGIPPGIILLVPFRGEAARTRTGAAHSCDLEKRGTSADKPHRCDDGEGLVNSPVAFLHSVWRTRGLSLGHSQRAYSWRFILTSLTPAFISRTPPWPCYTPAISLVLRTLYQDQVRCI